MNKLSISLIFTLVSFFVQAQNPLERGLMAYYPFNGNTQDALGQIHGTLNGAELQEGMRCGQDSYHFDGYKSYIDFGNHSSFSKIEEGLTISLWVYIEPKHQVGLSLLAGRWAFNKHKDQFGLFLGGKNTIVFSVGDGYKLEEGVFGKNRLQNDTWYHLVGVWRPNGDMAIFINGELNNVGKQAGRGINTESDVSFKVGRQVEGADRPFKGYLDEVRVYNRGLSTKEIKMLFDKDYEVCNQVLVQGNVQDKNTGELLTAEVIVEDMENGQSIKKVKVDPVTMDYEVTLVAGKKYAIYAKKDKYLPISKMVSTVDVTSNTVIRKDLEMAPFKVGEIVRLNNIFFDTGKASLRPESYRELDRVIKLFTYSPNLKIEIDGHTDSVGSELSNQNLSEARAKTVRNYLLSRDLSENKISYVGFGESLPIAENATDEGRQLNRRVEFKILDL